MNTLMSMFLTPYLATICSRGMIIHAWDDRLAGLTYAHKEGKIASFTVAINQINELSGLAGLVGTGR